jgi:hypothetical protein
MGILQRGRYKDRHDFFFRHVVNCETCKWQWRELRDKTPVSKHTKVMQELVEQNHKDMIVE